MKTKDGDTNDDASEAAEETGPAEAYNPKLMDDILVEMGTYRARSFLEFYAVIVALYLTHCRPSQLGNGGYGATQIQI
jgi:hypothetical protein